MKTISKFLTAVSALVLCGTRAADLGDPAADLKIAKWVKGEPVNIAADDKNIYVVEFWATWCPPCRTSIPHLTEIQKRFKDKNVVIIGVSDEKESVVAPFVKNLGAKMDYRVAVDDDRETSSGYMKAYGIGGIPHAFIVQNKKVIWHGHPMAGLDKTLEEVTAGKYDVGKAKAKLKAEALYEQFREAAAEGNDARADELAKELEESVKDGSFPGKSFDAAKEKKEMRVFGLKQELRGALYQDEKDQAEELSKKIKTIDPAFDVQSLRDEIAAQKLARTYFQAISGEGDADQASKTGEELAPKLKGHPEFGNNVAWAILTDKGVKHRDVPLALKIAKQASEDSDWKQAHIIDTYARALFDSGKKEEAIEYQKKALAAASEEDKAQYERILASYKEGKVPSNE